MVGHRVVVSDSKGVKSYRTTDIHGVLYNLLHGIEVAASHTFKR